MRMNYKHLFIDLDRTLYDFDESTRITFSELYDKFNLHSNGVSSFNDFLELYKTNNVELWSQYREGKISKKFLNVERFYVSLLHFGIDDRAFAGRFAAEYLQKAPLNKALFPGAMELLEYLHPRYTLHIITNGFDDVQKVKMEANDLNRFFTTVTTSEEAKAKKPDEAIFLLALKKASAHASESLMIGDDYDVDMLGAKNVGMDQVLFDPFSKATQVECTFVISDLLELKGIL